MLSLLVSLVRRRSVEGWTIVRRLAAAVASRGLPALRAAASRAGRRSRAAATAAARWFRATASRTDPRRGEPRWAEPRRAATAGKRSRSRVPPEAVLPLAVVGGMTALALLCVAIVVGVTRVTDRDDRTDPSPAAARPTPAPPPSSPPANPRTVRFEVTGTGTLSFLIYSDGAKRVDEPQRSAVPLPWSVRVPCCGDEDYAVVATAAGSNAVTCRILVDGVQVDVKTRRETVECRWLPG